MPQGGVLGAAAILLYASYIPDILDQIIATFVDYSVILAVGNDCDVASRQLQIFMNKICEYTRKWKIKLSVSPCEIHE